MTRTRRRSSAGSTAAGSGFMRGLVTGVVSKVSPFYRPRVTMSGDRQTPLPRPPAHPAGPEQWSSPADSDSDGTDERNAVRPGANTVSDTRALLSRIAQFRKRLEAMPRLVPVEGPAAAPAPEPTPEPTEPASRTQA